MSPSGVTGATRRSQQLSGGELLEFVTTRMTMSSYYQPLVIRSLIEAGGQAAGAGAGHTAAQRGSVRRRQGAADADALAVSHAPQVRGDRL